MNEAISRRRFIQATTAVAGVFAGTGAAARGRGPSVFAAGDERPALLGGSPLRTAPFPEWPVTDQREEDALLDTLRNGDWYRGSGDTVNRFEAAYAELTGARHCVATANGTSALFASLAALDVGPGDEVVLPPYTFVATLNVILLQYALPIFVDSDVDTFQIDAGRVEAALSDRTAGIVPVHLGGNAADLDAIAAVAGPRRIPILEDACQAHLGEWRGRKLGTVGAMGCFSFQASKNLNSGEGGAVLTDDDSLAERCYAFHNNSRGRRGSSFGYQDSRGANLRLTEFQGALLLAQMTRLEEQSRRREQNAAYLTGQLEEIPGIRPARMYPGCTRNAYHLYMFRYDPGRFAGLPRARFLEAMAAEGIPCSGGYSPLNTHPMLKTALESKAYRRIYPPELLAEWEERTACPANERLCEEAVWLGQTRLLGPRGDMDDIAAAIRKVQKGAGDLLQTA